MFFVTYMLAELRRRLGRTLVTAIGLAVGVGLVITVSALSRGLDDAQAEVLRPLTGVGTDLSVTRPINLEAGPEGLSDEDRRALRAEMGGARVRLRSLGEPGEKFSRDDFVPTGQLSFPAGRVTSVRRQAGVKDAAGSLTLNAVHIEGTVPEQPAGGRAGTFERQAGPPENIDVASRTVTGVDVAKPALAAVTPGQIVRGRYLSTAKSREAVLNLAYANQNDLGVGDKVSLGGKKFTVVGLARTPLGGQASDVYVKLGELQALAGRKGRINTINVRAKSSDDVAAVAASIRKSFDGASVTTAEDLADRVSGSLVDARRLADRLGTALVIVALLAAFLIASLLSLSSVTKRIRELGTLKALGWRQWLVVRQVAGESVLQGVLGGLIGIGLGVAGALLIEAASPTLEATFAQAAQQGPRFIGPGGFGQGDVASASTTVDVGAPVSVVLALSAVGLAMLGGLIAGAVGGLRAARLRPADALRSVE
ncbi:MAG TPA: ABC transporter permease [Gaiellaceae bacterium]|jgi:ABC-type antimicrobial peptide transport system permease subunit|nr:ABC transporter permease [Gaiellaceae bacterium]